jgi:hypothetical protein
MALKRSNARRARRVGLVLTVVLLGLLAFGISGTDEAAIRAFDEAADRWQTNPEFRSVATEYCVRGSGALRTRPLLVRARRLIVAMRSLPLLPRRLAMSPTSRSHYENFSNGPLCAYLFLCGEQSVPEFVAVLEACGHTPEATDAELRLFLDSFHMDVSVCKDAGAIRSAAALVHDTAPQRPFAIRHSIGPLLVPHIRTIARQLRVPEDPAKMTPEQQLAVLERLDAHVRRHDPELWRTKQLSDFCGGVWAQAFSPPYQRAIKPLVAMHRMGAPALIALTVWFSIRRRRSEGRIAPDTIIGAEVATPRGTTAASAVRDR